MYVCMYVGQFSSLILFAWLWLLDATSAQMTLWAEEGLPHFNRAGGGACLA